MKINNNFQIIYILLRHDVLILYFYSSQNVFKVYTLNIYLYIYISDKHITMRHRREAMILRT